MKRDTLSTITLVGLYVLIVFFPIVAKEDRTFFDSIKYSISNWGSGIEEFFGNITLLLPFISLVITTVLYLIYIRDNKYELENPMRINSLVTFGLFIVIYFTLKIDAHIEWTVIIYIILFLLYTFSYLLYKDDDVSYNLKGIFSLLAPLLGFLGYYLFSYLGLYIMAILFALALPFSILAQDKKKFKDIKIKEVFGLLPASLIIILIATGIKFLYSYIDNKFDISQKNEDTESGIYNWFLSLPIFVHYIAFLIVASFFMLIYGSWLTKKGEEI